MKTIVIFDPITPSDKMFDPNDRDGYKDPYIYLKERLADMGYKLKPYENEELHQCKWLFFNDAISTRYFRGFKGALRKFKARLHGKQLRDVFKDCLKENLQNKMVLFLWEPPTVMSRNWEDNLYEKFNIIFTWNDRLVDGKKFHKIHWPQTHKFPVVEKVPFNKKKLLVNITANKYSSHPRELYTARRKTIRYFEKKYPNDFDLYGVGWNQPVGKFQKLPHFYRAYYPSYRGVVRNKWDVYPKYKFGLCYENICNEPGYITEKIFDCMQADCVPVYWGASNTTDYVDENAFIDRRHFKSDEELSDFLNNVAESEYKYYQEAIKAYLNSDRFKLFLPNAYTETIINVLKL